MWLNVILWVNRKKLENISINFCFFDQRVIEDARKVIKIVLSLLGALLRQTLLLANHQVI